MKRVSVLITGSSKGLGKQLALVFAENNYNVILHGRNEENLQRVRDEISDIGVESIVVQGDLKNYQTIERLYKKAKEKDISVLINNAAITCPGLSFEDLTEEQIIEMTKVNLIAPIILSKKIYSLFLGKKYGNIININSLAGLEVKKSRSIYCATKYGLRGFGDALGLEGKEKNIQIMGVYLSKMKNSLEDSFGMDLRLVAHAIYDSFKLGDVEELVIDGRPKRYKKIKTPVQLVIDGKKYEI